MHSPLGCKDMAVTLGLTITTGPGAGEGHPARTMHSPPHVRPTAEQTTQGCHGPSPSPLMAAPSHQHGRPLPTMCSGNGCDHASAMASAQPQVPPQALPCCQCQEDAPAHSGIWGMWGLTLGWDRHHIPSHDSCLGQGDAAHPAPQLSCLGTAPTQNQPPSTLTPPSPSTATPAKPGALAPALLPLSYLGQNQMLAHQAPRVPCAAGTSQCCCLDTAQGKGRPGLTSYPCPSQAAPAPVPVPEEGPAAGLPSCPPTRFLCTDQALGTSTAFLPLPSPPLGPRQGRCSTGSPLGCMAPCWPCHLTRCQGDTGGDFNAGWGLAVWQRDDGGQPQCTAPPGEHADPSPNPQGPFPSLGSCQKGGHRMEQNIAHAPSTMEMVLGESLRTWQHPQTHSKRGCPHC